MATTSLGNLTVYLKADIKDLRSKLQTEAPRIIKGFTGKVKKEMQKASGTVRKENAKFFEFGGSPQQALAQAKRYAKQLENTFLGMGMKVQSNIKMMDQGFKVSAGNVVDSSRMMGRGIQHGANQGVAGLLSLKAMVGKIVHYITFSIGVQMVMAVRQGFTQMIEDFKDFERAVVNAVTVSGYLNRSFNEVKDRITDISKALGKKTVFSAVEVSKAFYDLASAGIDVGKVTEKELEPILNYAAATQSELADATRAVLTTMKAFRLEMEDTQRIVDTFTGAITSSFFTMEKMMEFMKYAAPIAGSLGMELEETVAAGIQLVNMGLEGSQAGQRLNMVLTKLLKPSEKAQKMLSSLGITIDDINPEFYSLTEILYKLQGAGFGAAEAATMFRARTAAAAAVLVDSVDSIDRYNTELLLSKGITESVAEAQETTLWASFKMMQDTLQEAGLQIAENLLPHFQAFTNFIKDTLAPAIKTFFTLFMQHLPMLLNLIKLYIKIKVVMFAVMKIYKLYGIILKGLIMLNKARILLSGLLFKAQSQENVSTAASIPIKEAAAAATAKLAIASAVLAGIIGGIVLIALLPMITSMMDFTDSMLTLGETTKETGLNIKKSFGTDFDVLIKRFSEWELAVWEASNSLKDFQESLSMIRTEAAKGGLGTYMDDLSSLIEGSNFGEMIELSLIVADPYKVTGNISKAFTGMFGDIEDLSIKTWNSMEGHSKISGKEIKVFDNAFIGKSLVSDFRSEWISQNREIVDAGMEEFNRYFEEQFPDLNIPDDFFGSIQKIAMMSGKAFEILTGSTWRSTVTTMENFRAMALISVELGNYKSALEEVDASLTELWEAEEHLSNVREKHSDDIGMLSKAEERFIKAKDSSNESMLKFIGTVRELVTEVRKYSDSVNTVIGDMQEMITITRDLEYAKEDLSEAYINEEEAILKVSEAINQYGADANEVRNLEVRLAKATRSRIALQEKVAELDSKTALAKDIREATYKYGVEVELDVDQLREELKSRGLSNEISKYIDKYTEAQQEKFIEGEESLKVRLPLSDTEEDLLKTSYELMEVETKLVSLTQKQNLYIAKRNALIQVRDNYENLLNEKLKLYLETQLKIFDIEEKLYKLREGEKDQFDKLFQKMAEEGLVNEETIDLYKEMKTAEGEVLSMNHSLMDVFGDLSDEQREYAEDLINTTEGTDEYNAALAALEGAGLTEEQIAIIVKYNKAEDRLNASVQEFGDVLGPVMDDLIDAGVVSPEVAAAWNDIADNALEVAKANIDLAISQSKVSDGMNGLIGNTTRLSKALQDEAGEDFYNTLGELVDRMDLTDKVGGNLLGTLNSFYEETNDQVSDFTEGQIIAALSMIQAADAASLWESGMSGVNLATEMNVGSLQEMVNSADSAYTNENLNTLKAIEDILKNTKEAINGVGGAISQLEETLKEYLKLASGMDPLEFSFRYNFAELMEEEDYKGNIEKAFTDLESLDLDFTSALTRWWSEVDWNKFSEEVQKSDLAELITETLKTQDLDLDFEISPSMTGEQWGKLMETYPQTANRVFELYQTTIPIYEEWPDGSDSWNTYLGTLGEHKSDFDDVLTSFRGILNVDDTWDGKTFSEFMSTISADKLGLFLALLEDKGIPLPITSDTTELYSDLDALNLYTLPDKILQIIADTTNIDAGLRTLKDEIDLIFGPDHTISVATEPIQKSVYTGPMGGGIGSVTAGAGMTFPSTSIIPGGGQGNPMKNVEIAGEKVGNVLKWGGATLEGTFNDIGNDIYAVYDLANGNVISTYNTAEGKFTESFDTAATSHIGMVDTGSGVFVGAMKTSSIDFSDSMDLASSEFKYASYLSSVSVEESGKGFWFDIWDAGDKFEKKVISAADAISIAASNYNSGGGTSWWWNQKGGVFNRPTPGIFGEAGAEALIPLEGKNKKFGESILTEIIPKYYPNLLHMAQEGGIFGGSSKNVTYTSGPSNTEEYNIMGPINVTTSGDVNDFVNQLKYKSRTSRRG